MRLYRGKVEGVASNDLKSLLESILYVLVPASGECTSNPACFAAMVGKSTSNERIRHLHAMSN